MATLPESVDYTDKDFDALRARLIALIKRQSTAGWSTVEIGSREQVAGLAVRGTDDVWLAGRFYTVLHRKP